MGAEANVLGSNQTNGGIVLFFTAFTHARANVFADDRKSLAALTIGLFRAAYKQSGRVVCKFYPLFFIIFLTHY